MSAFTQEQFGRLAAGEPAEIVLAPKTIHEADWDPFQAGIDEEAEQARLAAQKAEQPIPQPDANGEFLCPADGAKFMAATYGIPQTPLNGKAPLLPEWQDNGSTDFEQIDRWAKQHRGCNFGSVAKAILGGHFVVEVDSLKVRERIRQAGIDFSSRVIVESSQGRGHRWYLQSPDSISVGNIAQNSVIGRDFSLRVDDQQCVSPGSVHPKTGRQYRLVSKGPITAATIEELAWLKSQKVTTDKEKPVNDVPIPDGTRNSTLASIAGKYRDLGESADDIYERLSEINRVRCTPMLSDQEVRTIAQSVGRYPDGITRRMNEIPLVGGVPAGSAVPPGPLVLKRTDDVKLPEEIETSEAIPDFDSSVINGIYAKFVELATRGTTLAPQFAFVIAKTIVGARMAGKVKFDNLDVEPRYYTALIGETGSGKGEAWRRIMQILEPPGAVGNCGLKIINSVDSGAGLRDLFFAPPEAQPVLCYVDEIESLGNKAATTRNPAILDTMIELANSTSISRTLAKRSGGGSKTKTDARFCMVMCGQGGDVYAKAFAGRAKLGLWDRLYPECGVPVEAGDIPPVDVQDAHKLRLELDGLDYSGTMVMPSETKTRLDDFWKSQPAEIRKKARFKKNLLLDAYMSAFGRGLKTVELEDAETAIKIFVRQMVIRRVHFTNEVPDRIGFYLGLIKKITEKMRRQLATGLPPEAVARSRRDYEKATNAFRDNEEHIFAKAWETHSRVHLQKVQVERANGQRYEKYLPMPED